MERLLARQPPAAKTRRSPEPENEPDTGSGAGSLDPSPDAILGLQRSAGNSVVARAVAAQSRTLARLGGWADARPGGWNAEDRRVGKVERIPLEGLSGGLADAAKRGTTGESSAHKAIAVVPDNVDWSKPVEVLLHFHGYGPGDREPTTDDAGTPAGTVRDVEADEIEQQLQASGRSMVAILPQGTATSGFSISDPAAYVSEAFTQMTRHLPIAADPKVGRVVVSGHSGGGVAATASAKAFQAKAGADEDQWLAASPLFLFDSINGTGELANIRALLDGWLALDLKILTAAGPRAAELVAKRGVRFHSTWTGGVYKGTNVGGDWVWTHTKNGEVVNEPQHVDHADSVEGHRDKWFKDHAAELAPLDAALVDALRTQHYKVEHVAGTHNFTVGTGGPATSRNTDMSEAPTPLKGQPAESVPDYTPGTGHLEEALDELPGGKGSQAATTTTGQDAGVARTPMRTTRAAPTIARQPTPPPAPPQLTDHTAAPDPGEANSCPVATPDGQPTQSPYQPVLDALAALKSADDAVKAATGAKDRRKATARRDAALKDHQHAVETLATMLRENLPPKFMLDGYLARTEIDDAAKVQTLGLLAVEVERMEFLLGRLFYRGEGTWETGGANKGPFPDVYRSTVGGDSGQAWCTKFSGYARSRLGFHAAPGSSTTSMFHSGWRFQHWSETGKTLGGSGENQTTAADQTVASGAHGSALIETSDWKKLTHDLTKARNDAKKKHEDEAAARQTVADTFLAAHAHPQPGDLVIKTRGSATTNDYSGGESHTMIVERAQGHVISTIEGNRGDQVGGRVMDLSDPGDTGQIIFLSRLGSQFFGDPATPAPEQGGIAGAINSVIFSEALLVGLMQAANARLVEIDSAAGFIKSSDATGSVVEWQTGTAGPAAAGGTASEE
jgi:hypothetical protein